MTTGGGLTDGGHRIGSRHMAALAWIPVTPGGPRPDGFALWLVRVRNDYPGGAFEAAEVFYAREADGGGNLLDVWGDDVGWLAKDATHYAEIGDLPAAD